MNKTKKMKKNKNSAPVRPSRPVVISYRLTTPQYSKLKDSCKRSNVLGARTERQFARKILCDYLNGRLDYKNPADLRMDLDLAATSAPA